MSFLSAVGPYINAASQVASGALEGQNQGNAIRQQRDTQQALLAYQMQRQQEQDALKAQLAQRLRDQTDQQHLIEAIKNGLPYQGAVSRENPALNAVPLPKAPVDVSTPDEAAQGEAIPGAAQRKTELDAQQGPSLTIGKYSVGAVPTPKPVKPVRGEVKETADGLVEIDPVTGRATPVLDANGQPLKGYHPEKTPPGDHYAAVTVTAPDGSQHVARFNTKTGQIEDTGMGAKAPGAKGGSSAGAQVPVADMEARLGEIQVHARALAKGKYQITPGMQAREAFDYANALGNASGHPSLKNIVASKVMGTVDVGGKAYQHYQALMNSTRAIGDDVAKVFKGRQNEQAVNREVGLAQLTPQDFQNPQVVEQKLNRLQHVIDLAKMNNPQQATRKDPATRTDELLAEGKSPAEIRTILQSEGYHIK